MMPRVDGFHVLDYLQRTAADQLGRVVVMTALPEESIPEPLPRVLFKPFDIDLLSEYARLYIRSPRRD